MDTRNIERILQEIKIEFYEDTVKNSPITVSKYKLILKENTKVDPTTFFEELSSKIKERLYDFTPMRKGLREGFTLPEILKNNSVGIMEDMGNKEHFVKLKTIYFKETYKRLEIPLNGKLEKYKIREVLPENRVYFVVKFGNNSVDIYRIGGEDNFALKAKNTLLTLVKDILHKKWHQEISYKFTRDTMYTIMSKLTGTTYIDIDPRDNEKFAKVIGIKRKIQYYVEDIKIRGYKILNAPKIREILEEEKIKVTEVIGRISLNNGQKVTIWVKTPNKITFYLSPKIVGSESEDKMFDFAISLYEHLITSTNVPEITQESLLETLSTIIEQTVK